MKNYTILIILSAIVMICIPLAIVKMPKNTEAPIITTKSQTNLPSAEAETTAKKQDTIAVFRTAQNKTVEMEMFEYVCGSVAAEMPLAYNEEALKAQAVACYTNAIRQKSTTSTAPSNISDDIKTHQGYIDPAQRKEKWGDNFEKYEQKLKKAVKAVENQALYYNNQPCVAAFHAISCGKTENSQNLWGAKMPYLTSVDSSGDKAAKGYSSTISYNTEGTNKCIEALSPKPTTIKDLKNAIKITKTSPSGTVLEATINGNKYTGEQIRSAFGLRSPVFTITTEKDTIAFTVKGYGHGVGMSQHGANYLAEKGYTYDKILAHYYKGAEIKSTDT